MCPCIFVSMKAEKEDTQTVRISKEVVREIKMNIAEFGGTIKSILERGAEYAMGENKVKNKKKK